MRFITTCLILIFVFSIIGCKTNDRQTSNEKQLRIVTDLPTNPKLVVEPLNEPDTYRITIAQERGVDRLNPNDLGYWKWWMFRVDGAKGQTLKFEILNPINGHKSATLNPVYMNGGNIDDLKSFQSVMTSPTENLRDAPNGSKLPDTSGQRWHFIENAYVPSATEDGRADGKTLIFEHTFTDDKVWVAMRYPCTPEYLANWYEWLKIRGEKDRSLYVKVYDIGVTTGGYPMHIIIVGEQRPTHRPRPTLLMYGREHAQDQDASFVVQGAVQFLLSDDPRAIRLRHLYTFVFIPMLDPEGAHDGRHNRIRATFHRNEDNKSFEARQYKKWLEKWLKKNRRVDVIMNLHNHESNEAPHLMCWQMESEHTRGHDAKLVELAVWEQATKAGYVVRNSNYKTNVAHSRFGGMVRRHTDAVLTGWMVNAQAPEGHLTLAQLRDKGKQMLIAATQFMRESNLYENE